MNRLFSFLAIAGTMAVALQSSVALAQPGKPDVLTAPPVPFNLEVRDGSTLFLKGEARGTQNYICLPSGSGFAWTFFSPQATLFFTVNLPAGEFRQQIITHFLSPNPDQGGARRATWQSSFDTSAVWAEVAPDGLSTDANFVAPGAIPWLLLQVVGKQVGPTGGETLTNTTFVQRLNTCGGLAPASGCSTAANVGGVALVPYTADYFFYKKTAGY
jgi:hypothetical protein